MNTEKARILFVDDEPFVLEGLRRQLHGRYEMELITSPARALSRMREAVPFNVIVADMVMPSMNGIELLRESARFSPDTVRVMLTGNREQSVAAEALNEGQVYRFLSKPCSSEELGQVIDAALEYHHHLVAERGLLQNTLSGAIKVLTDILHALDPVTFADAMEMREDLKELCQACNTPFTWELAIAAMLHGIGSVMIPHEIIVKSRNHDGGSLTPEEQAMMAKIPELGAKLIEAIPRLEGVAKIIRLQDRNYDGSSAFGRQTVAGESLPFGSRALKILKTAKQGVRQGNSLHKAFGEMLAQQGIFDLRLLSAALKLKRDQPHYEQAAKDHFAQRTALVNEPSDLAVGQRMVRDVITKDGRLLISAGTLLSETMIERIKNFAELVGVNLPLKIEKSSE